VDFKSFGNRIRALREARGWKQPDLANASGVSYRSVQAIETAQTNPTIEAVESLGGALKVNLFHDLANLGQLPGLSASELKALIEEPGEASHRAVSLVLQALLTAEPGIRASALAVIYGDPLIAKPYLSAVQAKSKNK
jgi:transcriptional regulator with XRE-family HTH domain